MSITFFVPKHNRLGFMSRVDNQNSIFLYGEKYYYVNHTSKHYNCVFLPHLKILQRFYTLTYLNPLELHISGYHFCGPGTHLSGDVSST